jgi:hypothetical protein
MLHLTASLCSHVMYCVGLGHICFVVIFTIELPPSAGNCDRGQGTIGTRAHCGHCGIILQVKNKYYRVEITVASQRGTLFPDSVLLINVNLFTCKDSELRKTNVYFHVASPERKPKSYQPITFRYQTKNFKMWRSSSSWAQQ